MNMIDLNKSLFKNLYSKAYSDNSLRFHAFIETTEDDKEFIKNAKSVSTRQSLDLKIAVIVMQDDSLFLAIIGGHIFSDLPPEVRIQRLEESAGALTVLGGKQALAPRDSYNFMDLNWSTIKSSENGRKEDLTSVKKNEAIDIFENFTFYKIESLPFTLPNGVEDRFVLLLLLLLNIGDGEKLKLKSAFLDILINLDNFPFDLLHSAYISQNWQHSYIDIYRCVELLYPIPRIMDLRGYVGKRISCNLDKQIRAIDLFEDVKNAIGWREIELSGLERLVQSCSEENITIAFNTLVAAEIVNNDEIEIIKELSKVEIMNLGTMKPLVESIRDKLTKLDTADLKKVSEYKIKRSAGLIANKLYSTRNSLVHFRSPSEPIDNDTINASFKALVYILRDLYEKFQGEVYT